MPARVVVSDDERADSDVAKLTVPDPCAIIITDTEGSKMWKKVSALFAVVAFVGTPIMAVAQSDEIFHVYDINSATGFDLGKGFDILTASPRNQCVVIQEVIDHPELGPESVIFRSYRIENSQQLDKALGISASASMTLGIGSASVSSSYSESLSISSYTLNYVVQASVRRKGKSIKVQDLQDRYKRLLSSGNADAYRRFRSICGDGYISEMPVGGDFKAVIQIATNSQAEAQALSISLGGSYSAVSGSASFSNAVKKAAQTNEVRIWSYRRAGEGPVAISRASPCWPRRLTSGRKLLKSERRECPLLHSCHHKATGLFTASKAACLPPAWPLGLIELSCPLA